MTNGDHKKNQEVKFMTRKILLEDRKLWYSNALHTNLIDKYIRILQEQQQQRYHFLKENNFWIHVDA